MRVAVVGAGVAGLVSAYLLRREHRVEVFEQAERAGGHANTVMVNDGPEPLALDVGFVVYNEQTYTGFTRLLRELGVATQRSDMSFSVRSEREDFEFSSRGLRGYVAQWRNALNPVHLRMIVDLLRFHRDARRVVARDELHDVSFEQYLDSRPFGRAFRERLIVPLTAATWSNAPADILSFPANYLFRFLEQHGVLAVNAIPQWRSIEGGSRAYVRAILDALGGDAVHLGDGVSTVSRDPEGVTLVTAKGERRQFDAVVIACHPDQALEMLADPLPAEREALAGFRYAPNHVVLHTDERLLPRRAAARASWNYQVESFEGAPDTLTMSYDLNRLQNIAGPTTYCVSVNPGDRVRSEAVLASFDFMHPVYSASTLIAQQALAALNGERRTYFAGAYQGYGFHEDGVQSAIRVAERLGVSV